MYYLYALIMSYLQAGEWSAKATVIVTIVVGVLRALLLVMRVIRTNGTRQQKPYVWQLVFTAVLTVVALLFVSQSFQIHAFGDGYLPMYIIGSVVLALVLVNAIVWCVTLVPGSSMYPHCKWYVTLVVRAWRGWLLFVLGWLLTTLTLTVLANTMNDKVALSGIGNTYGWSRLSEIFATAAQYTLHILFYGLLVAAVLWIIFAPINAFRHWRQRRRAARSGGGSHP